MRKIIKREEHLKKKEATKIKQLVESNKLKINKPENQMQIRKKLYFKNEGEKANLLKNVDFLRTEKKKLIREKNYYKNKYQLSEKKYQKEVLKTSTTITELRKENNIMKKKLKNSEKMMLLQGKNEKEKTDKKIDRVEKDKKDMSLINNEEIKTLKESNMSLKKDIESLAKESNLKEEDHRKETILLNDILKNQEIVLKEYLKENISLREENKAKNAVFKLVNCENEKYKKKLNEMNKKVEVTNLRIFNLQNRYTEMSMNTSVFLEKVNKKKKFKLFCF